MADVQVELGAKDLNLESTLKTVQTELTVLREKLDTADLSMSEIEKTAKRLSQVEGLEKKLQGIANGASETTPKLDGMTQEIKKTGSASEQTGKQSETGFGKIFSAAAAAQVAVNVAGAAMEAAFAAVRNAIGEFGKALDLGGKLSDLSDRTGETAGNLLVLGRAFQNTGKSADDAGVTLNKMQKYIEEAASGASANAPVFEDLKINLEELRKKSPVEQMQILAERIAGLENPGKQASLTMDIFAKSGGELLPLFKNFSEELKTARGQLGSTVDIMDRQNKAFDAVSDKIVVIKGKFIEFAAGVLDKMVPALNAITEGLSRIDAAKLGQNLANAFLGGQEAMKGFQAAVDAFSLGKFEEAFDLLWDSIVLQSKTTANEIYKNLDAAMDTFVSVAIKLFNPDGKFATAVLEGIQSIASKAPGVLASAFASGTWNSLYNGMRKIGLRVGAALLDAIAAAFDTVAFFDPITAGLEKAAGKMTEMADRIGKDAQGAATKAKDTLKDTFAEIPDEFRKNYQKTKPVFKDLEGQAEALRNKQGDITEELENQDYYRSLALEKTKGERKEIEENLTAREKADKREKELAAQQKKDQSELAEQRKKEQQENLALDLQIAQAKASGNTEEVKALEAKKEYNKLLKQALDSGMGVAEAQNFARAMMDANINSRSIVAPSFDTPKKDSLDMANALGNAKNFTEAMQKIKQIEALEHGKNTSKAIRENMDAFGEFLGVKLKGMDIRDLLAALGVDKIAENSKDQLKQLKDYINEQQEFFRIHPLSSDEGKKRIEELRGLFEDKPWLIQADGYGAQKVIDAITSKKQIDLDTTKATEALAGLATQPVVATLDASQSIQQIRSAISSEPIAVTIKPTGGDVTTSVFDAIRTAVETAATLLGKIEPKLPTNALTA